jgi:hypothetical protein
MTPHFDFGFAIWDCSGDTARSLLSSGCSNQNRKSKIENS